MKKVNIILFLLLFGPNFLLLVGCNPHNSIVLSNNETLKKLNEMVNERSVRVTTTDSVYTGDNIIINRDSTIVENYSTEKNVISLSSIKSIIYTSSHKPPDGIIILKNDLSIKAQKIYMLMKDSVKYSEDVTTSVIFPTKELVKIQKRNHLASTFKGAEYGLLGGLATGAMLGTFVRIPESAPSAWPAIRLSRIQIWIGTTCFCGFLGTIAGAIAGAILGQWEDIDIVYNFEKSP